MTDFSIRDNDDHAGGRDPADRPAHPADLAATLNRLPPPQALWDLLAQDPDRQAEIFSRLTALTQAELARLMSPTDLAAIFARMDADDRADLFNLLSGDRQQNMADHLSADQRADLLRLASHREGTAGAIMTSDFAVLEPEMTVREALAELRRAAPDRETIYRSYVLDDAGRLIGSIRLHALILADEDTRIGQIMDPSPVSVSTDTDQEEVARLIAHYDILAIPVTDERGRLAGIVTHDDATDAMQAATTEDFQRISTVMPFTQNMREAGIGVLYSRRVVWLALLIFGNLFSGAGIAYFEEMILAYVSLVFFLPLLIDSSGNAGSQSATLMVRALATGDVALADWRRLILRELAVATALGLTLALVVFPIGAMRGGVEIALTVGLTMLIVVIIGSVVGMSLPFLLSRLRLDPATASGPLVTTISDGVGVLIYFSVATAILQG